VDPDFWLLETAPGHLGRTAARLASLPLGLLAAPEPRVGPGTSWAAFVYVVPLLAIRRRRDLLFWTLWLWVPVATVTTADLLFRAGQLGWIRYTLIASPALYALAAAPVSSSGRGTARHALPAAVALYCGVLLPAAYRPVHPPWREFGEILQLSARPGEALILDGKDPSLDTTSRSLLHYAYSPDRPWLIAGDRLGETARRRLARIGTAWLVSVTDVSLRARLPGATVEDSLEWREVRQLRRLSFGPRPDAAQDQPDCPSARGSPSASAFVS
jgi:hypothetical protein